MSTLTLELAELVVESFPTSPAPEPRSEMSVHATNSLACTGAICSTDGALCDTDFDCSTACFVPTNVCYACDRLSDQPENC